MGVLVESKRSIRSARKSDGQMLAALAWNVLSEKDRKEFDWDALPGELSKFAVQPGFKSFVCERNGVATAFLLGFCLPCFWNPTKPLAQVMVWWSDDALDGLRLMNKFRKWAEERGAAHILAAARDERSCELYRRLGWEYHETNFLKGL